MSGKRVYIPHISEWDRERWEKRKRDCRKAWEHGDRHRRKQTIALLIIHAPEIEGEL